MIREALDLKQRQWVLKKSSMILEKYMACFPLTEEKWKELKNDVTKVFNDSKNNSNIEEIMIVIYDFFDNLDRAYRKGCGENVS